MLLAPAHGIAQTVDVASQGVDQAATRQPMQLPPVPAAQEQTRQRLQIGVQQYDARRLPALEHDYIAGRTSFTIWTTMASIYGGVALSNMLGIQQDRAIAATLLATTGIGFLASNYGTKRAQITEAMADAYGAGLVIGATNGLLLSAALADYGDAGRTIHGATLSGMALGGALAYSVAKRTDPTRGQVAFTVLGSKMGLATAGLGLMMAQPDGAPDSSLLALFAGLNLGTLTGAAVAPGLDWSISRVRRVGLGAMLGAITGWSAATMVGNGAQHAGGKLNGPTEAGNMRLRAASTLLGMWAGFGVSTVLTKDMLPDQRFAGKRGVMITPLPVKGGGMGASLTGTF